MLASDIINLTDAPFKLAQWTSAPMQLEMAAQLQWPINCVFELLSNHEKWPRIFPWLQDVTVDNTYALIKNGLGAKRTCHLNNNMVLDEMIVGWQPVQFYAYAGFDEMHPFGMVRHVSILFFQPDNEATILTWQHFFKHANPTAMQTQLDNSMSAAFQSLLTNCGGEMLYTK
jgi:hypothetical protein